MFEGLTISPPRKQPRFLAKVIASIDYLVPVLDIGYIFFWLPGFILFLFGYPLIFGWWSILIFPLTFAIFGSMRLWQTHKVFRRLGFRAQSDTRGFLGYLFAYQVLTSAAALRGYWQFFRRSKRTWR
jgi:biofilm PGA synthesis N-glycosyltransferase PgaC